mmetsp:Transcript_4930/g.7829  ORF Transcript_4930/g.7829 Transcript_4930/m.7829 type:complete len:274 (-) Transcript_4930:246-1067(-)
MRGLWRSWMFEKTKRGPVQWAIRRCLKKPAQTPITYSDETDCYFLTLVDPKNGRRLKVESFEKNELIVREWVDDRYCEETTLETSELPNWQLNASRWFRYFRSDYENAWKFWRGEVSRRIELLWFRENFSQRLFNATFKFRSDRINVLKNIVRNHLQDASSANGFIYQPAPKGLVTILQEHTGPRFFGHPAQDEMSARFRLVLESLFESGDLTKDTSNNYQLAPQSLITIADFELNERRHRDSKILGIIAAILTFIVSIATVFQAYSAWIKVP